jgi:glycosyltransferase involved in cell wall biosynthesis
MLSAIAREADRRRHRTTVVLSEIARDRRWLSDLDGLADVRFLHAYESRIAGIPPAMRALGSMLAGAEPAVIHTHFGTFDIPAALMRVRRHAPAVFWHEHGPVLDEPRARLRNSLRCAALGPLVNGILCVSGELCDELRARHAPARKLLSFPNAVDTDAFSPIEEDERRAARGALGLPEDARVILHFGWSWRRKGGDLLLAAAGLLADEPEFVALTVASEDLGALAGGNVRKLAPTGDVRRLYAAADLFLSCSRAEGAPLAVLEALACGLAVVASDLPAQRKILAGLPGAAIVPAEPAAIAAAIRRLASIGVATRREHRELASSRVRASYALPAWATRTVDLYEEAVGRRR